jgi:acyl-coenzyme A thioesterase PaaI-like protein
MAFTNPFADISNRYADLAPSLRQPLVTRAVGTVIPFVDTAGCFIEAYTPTRVAVRLDNRTAVQNHLGGVHAAALALLAETASGLVVALNVPSESAPLLRTMEVSFERYAREAVQAEAVLSTDEADHIQSKPIGRMDVEVTLTAPDADETLVSSELEWAWVPEEKLSG